MLTYKEKQLFFLPYLDDYDLMNFLQRNNLCKINKFIM